jgi:hypothetical protein
MPAPKSSRKAKRPSAKRAKPKLLERTVVLTRDLIQEAMDDAVRRGRMTRDDAEHLVQDLVRRSLRETEELFAGVTDRARREVDRARRVAGVGPSFPIGGYDDLTAAQVTNRLGDLTPPQLRKVRDYERRNANRKSVLAAIEKKLA